MLRLRLPPQSLGPKGNAVADSIVTFLRSMGPRPVFACTRAGGPCYRNVAKRDLKIRYGVPEGPAEDIRVSGLGISSMIAHIPHRQSPSIPRDCREPRQTFQETVNPIPRIRANETAVAIGSKPDTMNAAIVATVVATLRIANRMTSRIWRRASSASRLVCSSPLSPEAATPSDFESGSGLDGGAD